jgi:arginine N-succinyltransferase
MMIIRPAVTEDLDHVVALAKSAGIGVTTLPDSRDMLGERLLLAERSFTGKSVPEHAYYFFALEDTESGAVMGVSAIQARVGLEDVWYNYRVSNTVNAYKEMGIHRQTPTLYLTNDMTNCSELCTLFLHPQARNGPNGHLLSKARMLFMAERPDLFSEKVFAEMRGYSDPAGHSPFWESLGQKFFTVGFPRADYMTGLGNKSFIAELMPKYPIYIPFLSAAAQACVARVHDQTSPALALLRREGFNYNGLVDIFDAGPVVEAFLPQIRTVRESLRRYVLVSSAPKHNEIAGAHARDLVMVSNRQLRHFRVGLVPAGNVKDDTVVFSATLAEKLQVEGGDMVRLVALRGGD